MSSSGARFGLSRLGGVSAQEPGLHDGVKHCFFDTSSCGVKISNSNLSFESLVRLSRFQEKSEFFLSNVAMSSSEVCFTIVQYANANKGRGDGGTWKLGSVKMASVQSRWSRFQKRAAQSCIAKSSENTCSRHSCVNRSDFLELGGVEELYLTERAGVLGGSGRSTAMSSFVTRRACCRIAWNTAHFNVFLCVRQAEYCALHARWETLCVSYSTQSHRVLNASTASAGGKADHTI